MKQKETPVIKIETFKDPIEIKDVNEVEKRINEKRTAYVSNYTKTMKRNKIIGIAFMVVMLAMVLVAIFLAKYMMYFLIGLVVIFLGVVLYTRLTKNRLTNEIDVYVDEYATDCDSYLYKNEKITDIKMCFKAHPDDEEIRKMDFVNNLFQIGSRDVIKGKMNGANFEVSEVSLKTGDPKLKKTHKTVFVGKVFDFKGKMKDKGRVLLYLKGCGDAEPNKLDDVNQYSINGLRKEWNVYMSNESLKKVFTEDTIKALNEFRTDKILNDIIISFNEGSILVGLSFCDEYMIIPFEEEFKVSAGLDHYKKDINNVVRFHDALMRNPYLK